MKTADDPIRVFIGAGPEQRVPFLVLKSSIERRASRPVEVKNLLDLVRPHAMPKDKANRPRTPFSFQRFAIPAICGYKGRAIYLDSDMIVLDDIANLAFEDYAWDDSAVLATYANPSAWNAVLVIDCTRARWDLDEIVRRLDSGELTYRGLMEDMEGLGPVDRCMDDDRWNRLDEYVPGKTSILHFTDMRRQPWRVPGHPLEALWLDEAAGCMGDGEFATTLAVGVLAGHIRVDIADLLVKRIVE